MATATFAQLTQGSREKTSLSNHLLLAKYIPDDGVFVGVDGRVTVMYKVAPFNAQDKDHRSLNDTAGQISQSCLATLPMGALFQATFFRSRRIDEVIERYRAAGGEDIPLLKLFEDAVVAQAYRGVSEPLLQSGDYKFTVSLLTGIISVSILPSSPIGIEYSVVDAVRDLFSIKSKTTNNVAEERFLAVYKDLLVQAKEAAGRIERTLLAAGCQVKVMDDLDYIRAFREIMYPKTGHTYQVVPDPQMAIPLYERAPIAAVACNLKTGEVMAESMVFRALNLKSAPVETGPGHLSRPNPLLQGATCIDFLEDGYLTISARACPKNKMRWFLGDRMKKVKNGVCMPGREEIVAVETERAQTWIESGHTIFDTELTVVVRGENSEGASDAARRVRDRFTEGGIELMVEQEAGPAYVLRALPGNAFPPIEGARRHKKIVDLQIAELLPLYYHSRGTEEATALVYNRAGEPMPISVFGRGSNANGVMAGKSGSGKSFWLQYLTVSILRRPKSQAFVIDKGRSFANLVASFQGHALFVALGSARACINPFEGNLEEAAKFLTPFLVHLACPSGETLDGDSQGVLKAVINTVYMQNTRAVTWTDYEDLQKEAEGGYIAKAFKRMPVAAVPHEVMQNLEGSRASALASSWRILYRYRLLGYQQQPIERSSAINETQMFELIAQRFLVLDEEDGVYLYHEAADGVRRIQPRGYQVELDVSRGMAEVLTPEDVRYLQDRKVVFLVPNQVVDEERAAILERLRTDPEYTHATEQGLHQRAAKLLAQQGPVLYYQRLVGEADLQTEVSFGQFGHQLELFAGEATPGESITPGIATARRLVQRLKPYYGQGASASFFDGGTSFDLSAYKLISFEMDDLSAVGEHLQAAVMGALFHVITVYCKKPKNRNRRKYIPVDEGWALAKFKATAAPIEEAYRTIRKFNGAMCLVTQNLSDFKSISAMEPVLALSPNRHILRQEMSQARSATQHISCSLEAQRLIESLTNSPGRFSEIAIDAPELGVNDVAVFIPPPPIYWMLTTRPEDRDLLQERMTVAMLTGVNEDLARAQAISWCAEHHPTGAP